MKICVFTDSFRPYTSGVVRSIELFSREYSARGHEVYIFGPDYPQQQVPREEGVYRFISFPWPTNPDFSLPIPVSIQIRSTLKKIEPDLIHVHSPFLLGNLGGRVARIFELPLVFTFHTLYEQYVHYFPFAEKTSKQVIQAIVRDFCNRCNRIVAPSRLVRNYLEQIGVETAVSVIPTGIDLNEFSAPDCSWLQQNYGLKPEERALLFVGRLGKEKNLSFLIRAFKAISEQVPDLRLVLVGQGPEKENLRHLASRLDLEERIIFTGVLDRNQIVSCYASSHLFAFPSLTDTQGLVIGEAKAVGLPVVAIRAFGPAEMIEHGRDGFLTDPTLPSFTEAAVRILQDRSLYEQMSRTALHNVKKISAAACAEEMLLLYQHLIESGASAPRRRTLRRLTYRLTGREVYNRPKKNR